MPQAHTEAPSGLPPPNRRRAAAVQAVIGVAILGTTIIQGIVLVPFVLHHVGTVNYGIWLGIQGIAALGSLFDLGIASLVGQRISSSYGRNQPESILRYYSTGLAIQLRLMTLNCCLGLALAFAAWLWMEPSLAEKPQICTTFIISWLTSAMMLLSNGQKNVADSLQKPLLPLLASLCGAVVNIGVLVASTAAGLGITGIAVAGFLAEALVLLATLIYARRITGEIGAAQPSDPSIKVELMQMSPSLAIAKFSTSLVARIEPTLISALIGPSAAVAYSVTKKGAEVLVLILDRCVASIRSGFAHLVGEGKKAKTTAVFSTLSTIYINIALVFSLTYASTNEIFVKLWVGESLYAGGFITLANAVGLVMVARNGLYSVLLGETGDITRPAQFVALESLLRIGAMIVIGSTFGLIGVAVSTPLTCGIFSRWHQQRLMKKISISHRRSNDWHSLITFAGLGVAWFFVSQIQLPAESHVQLFISMLLVTAIGFVVIFTSNPSFRRSIEYLKR